MQDFEKRGGNDLEASFLRTGFHGTGGIMQAATINISTKF